MNCQYRRERNYVQNKLPEIEKQLKQFGYIEDDIKNLKNDKQLSWRISPNFSTMFFIINFYQIYEAVIHIKDSKIIF